MPDYLSLGQELRFLAQEFLIVSLTLDLYDIPLMLMDHKKIRRPFIALPYLDHLKPSVPEPIGDRILEILVSIRHLPGCLYGMRTQANGSQAEGVEFPQDRQ
jgi:hypothetical protein